MIVAAMNPCKCGYFPDMQRCTCSDREIRQYLKRVSMPLLDRMDISVEVSRVKYEELASDGTNESSAKIRARVEAAGQRQAKRYQGSPFRFNAELTAEGIKKYCSVSGEAQRLLQEAYSRLDLSARGYHRILKVARTIADLDGCGQIGADHICEAVGYRMFEKR